MEYSWFSSTDAISGADTLDLAFFARGSKGKYPVDHSSLARPEITTLATAVRDLLHTKNVSARQLKTLLIRSDQNGNAVWQLYLKDEIEDIITKAEASALPAVGGEVIYSNPKSPASVITKRLASFDVTTLEDTILGTPFRYAVEGFFQVNIPVYEQALRDMGEWIDNKPTIDLYSGVGSIGLTIGSDNTTLIEINEHAVREMRQNIQRLGKTAEAVLAPSEQALEYITGNEVVIVDPPRAGLHADVIERLLETKPERVVYLSCNPVTQARDVAMLAEGYGVRAHRGYNFFPRTPHIEHLVVLDRIEQ
jgi:23S rRNA (uracil1939-C5)-methyltransferase